MHSHWDTLMAGQAVEIQKTTRVHLPQHFTWLRFFGALMPVFVAAFYSIQLILFPKVRWHPWQKLFQPFLIKCEVKLNMFKPNQSAYSTVMALAHALEKA